MSTRPIEPPHTGRRTRCGAWLDMDPDERNAWAAWFERHGIDPRGLHPTLVVIADDTYRTITYAAAAIVDCHVIPVPRMVQLEAPALPFPEERPL